MALWPDAWSNPFPKAFRRRDANTRNCWGLTFQLTPEHPTAADFEPLKFSYDRLGEAALERLDALSPPPRSALPRNNGKYYSAPSPATSESLPPQQLSDSKEVQAPPSPSPSPSPSPPKRDLYALLRDNHHRDPTLSALWEEVNTTPAWVSWPQIARGQDVFYRYGGPCLTGLAFQSLLGGLGATRVVETLSRTGGFSTPVARHRLYETTQHVLQVTRSLESIQPGGDGFASSIRVRLLHAAVRRRIMALAKTHPGYYDTAAWGVPINDLDCAATIGTFSATLVWLALPRQAIFLREQEIEDYMALWRYVAFLTGTPTAPISTTAKARRFMESLLMLEISPSPTSRVLARNVIAALADQPPQRASQEFLTASARWLNGNKLCDALGLEQSSWYYTGLVAGQCAFFVGVCYLYRSVPWLDRRKIETLRQVFWKVIVGGEVGGLGGETVFEFKYVPQLGKETKAEDQEKTKSGDARRTGVERRNAIALVLACLALPVVTGVLIFGVVKGARTVGRWLWAVGGLVGS